MGTKMRALVVRLLGEEGPAGALARACAGHLSVVEVATLDEGIAALRRGPFDALVADLAPGAGLDLDRLVDLVQLLVAPEVPAAVSETGATEESAGMPTYADILARATSEATRQYLEQLLRDCQGNVSRAARTAGLERVSLHRLMRRHGVRAMGYRKRRSGG